MRIEKYDHRRTPRIFDGSREDANRSRVLHGTALSIFLLPASARVTRAYSGNGARTSSDYLLLTKRSTERARTIGAGYKDLSRGSNMAQQAFSPASVRDTRRAPLFSYHRDTANARR